MSSFSFAFDVASNEDAWTQVNSASGEPVRDTASNLRFQAQIRNRNDNEDNKGNHEHQLRCSLHCMDCFRKSTISRPEAKHCFSAKKEVEREKETQENLGYDEIKISCHKCCAERAKKTARTHSNGDGINDTIILRRVKLRPGEDEQRDRKQADERNMLQDHSRTSDLIPGVYEGGLKTWECSFDLCQFLWSAVHEHISSENEHTPEDAPTYDKKKYRSDQQQHITNFSCDDEETFLQDLLHLPVGCSVLELGCGHGLPGILLLTHSLQEGKQSCLQVLFNDYNDFVLHDVTLPNILANLNINKHGLNPPHCMRGGNETECNLLHALCQRVGFAAGDWMDIAAALQQETSSQPNNPNCVFATPKNHQARYNIILASETLYSPTTAQQTAQLLARHLHLRKGMGLVATKRYYFGVGGGTACFLNFCQKVKVKIKIKTQCEIKEVRELKENDPSEEWQEYGLSVRTLKVYDNGVGNIRELLSVRLVMQHNNQAEAKGVKHTRQAQQKGK